MYSRVNYSLIGSFVLIFIVGILLFVLWLGDNSFKQENDLYMLRTKESVAGLSRDSGVKLKGVNIGTVSDIHINSKNIEEVEIILSLQKDIPIKEDMHATISMFGLTGLAYVEISGGSNSSKSLVAENGKMPLIKSGLSTIEDLKDKANRLYSKLTLLLVNADKILTDENIKNFSALIKNANSATLKGITAENRAINTLEESTIAIKEFRESFALLSKNYGTLAGDISKEIDPIVESLHKASTSVESVAMTLEKSVNRGDYNLQKILQPSMNDIKEVSSQINALTRELKRSPSSILYKSRKPMRGPGE